MYILKQRLSIVNDLNINSLAFSAVTEVGDSSRITPVSKALAVHRPWDIFFGTEGHFDYPIFYQSIPKPIITEQINIQRYNELPQIHVQSITITAAAFSSVVHVGSTNIIQGEARVKHIRQLSE